MGKRKVEDNYDDSYQHRLHWYQLCTVERLLCLFYFLPAVLLSISAVCIGVLFYYWKSTMDVPIKNGGEEYSCCVLDALWIKQPSSLIRGGPNWLCNYGILAPIPVIVYAIVMLTFHMTRVFNNSDADFDDAQDDDAIIYCWVPNAVISALMCCYCIIYTGLITNGIHRTCKNYRGFYLKALNSEINHRSILTSSLNCEAVIDIMDGYHRLAEVPRDAPINSWDYMTTAIITSSMSAVFWVPITVLTSVAAHGSRDKWS